jgi:hypothetical protein
VLARAEELDKGFGRPSVLGQQTQSRQGIGPRGNKPFEIRERHARIGRAWQQRGQVVRKVADCGVIRPGHGREVVPVPRCAVQVAHAQAA